MSHTRTHTHTHLHRAADDVIRHVTALMRECVRARRRANGRTQRVFDELLEIVGASPEEICSAEFRLRAGSGRALGDGHCCHRHRLPPTLPSPFILRMSGVGFCGGAGTPV